MTKSHVKGATITYHYPKSDKECGGDYYDVDVYVKLVDGREFAGQYGDYYHDKGGEKALAFLDAFKAIFGDGFGVIHTQLNDREDLE